MNILITGAGGFLGQHLVAAARRAGHQVFAPSRQELDLTALVITAPPLPARVECMIHAAALVGGLGFVNKNPLHVMSENLRIHLGALALAKYLNVSTFVGVGSACAYPESSEPLHESQLWERPLHDSVFAYGTTKRVLEALQRAAVGNGLLYSTHAVLANLYGPGDRMPEDRAHATTALIRRFTRAARDGQEHVEVWGDGTAEREFLYVEDAARILVTIAERTRDGGYSGYGGHEVVNVGTGISTSIRSFVDHLVQTSGYQGVVSWRPDKPKGVKRKVLDISTLRKWGLVADTSLPTGIQWAAAWERGWAENGK